MNSSQDETLFQSFAKKNLDFCEKFFHEKLAMGIYQDIEYIIAYFQAILKETPLSFHEKQVINEINKKLNMYKKDFSESFKAILKKNMQKQYEFKNLDDGQLNLYHLDLESPESKEEKRMMDLLNVNLKTSLGDNLQKVLDGTNYLMMDNKDVYSEKVLSQSLLMVIKEYFQNHKAVIFLIHGFAHTWPEKLVPYYEKMVQHLETNDIYKKIESKATILKDTTQSMNLVPDLNSFFSDDNNKNIGLEIKTVSREDTHSVKPKLEPKLEPRIEPKIEEESMFDDLSKKLEEDLLAKKQAEEKEKEAAKAKELEEANRQQFIDPAKELAKSVQSMAEEMAPTFESQNFNEAFDIAKILSAKLSDENEATESKIIQFENFLKTIKDLQSKFLKVSPDFFEKNNLKQKYVIFEMLKSKAFTAHMSIYDNLVFRLLARTYKHIMSSETISVPQKTILFNTQLLVLEFALRNKTFLKVKNNPAIVFVNYIMNIETLLNPKLTNKFCTILSSITVPEVIDKDFFVNIIPKFNEAIKAENEAQKGLIKDNTKQMELDEQNDYYYYKILSHITPTSSKTTYEPIKSFVEKVWILHYIKKMGKKIDLSAFEDQDFTKFLSLQDKVYWHHSIMLFDNMVTVVNNKNNSTSTIEKMKELLNQINAELAKITIALDVNEKYTKTLFAFLKYRVDVISKTSNAVTIKTELDKIKPKELEFQAEIDTFAASVIALGKANIDIEKNSFNLMEYLKINDWYSFTNKNFKLLYVTPKENHFILINPENSTVHDYTKAKIWYVIKNKALKNISETYTSLNFGSFLIKSMEELKNNGMIE